MCVLNTWWEDLLKWAFMKLDCNLLKKLQRQERIIGIGTALQAE